MRKLFAIIGIIALVVMTLVSVLDFWSFRPKEGTSATSANIETGAKEPLRFVVDEEGGPSAEQNNPAIKDEERQTEITEEVLKKIEPEVNLSVPFVPQAPFANWDETHNEACEEAALIMARYWLTDQDLTKEKAEQEILASVDWQTDNWGGHYDLNVERTVELAQKYFGIQKIYFTAVNNIDDIKRELSKGNLVITPTAGRLLKNPYYRQPGPVYHMVVVKGYNEKEIITNDPGTRRGEDFSYSYDNFFNSIHNWPFLLGEKTGLSKDEKAVEVLKGEKLMIVVERG